MFAKILQNKGGFEFEARGFMNQSHSVWIGHRYSAKKRKQMNYIHSHDLTHVIKTHIYTAVPFLIHRGIYADIRIKDSETLDFEFSEPTRHRTIMAAPQNRQIEARLPPHVYT